MTFIKIKENEPFEVALRRFKKNIEKNGLLIRLKLKEFYEKPTTKKKRKLILSKKRNYKRIKNQKLPKKLY